MTLAWEGGRDERTSLRSFSFPPGNVHWEGSSYSFWPDQWSTSTGVVSWKFDSKRFHQQDCQESSAVLFVCLAHVLEQDFLMFSVTCVWWVKCCLQNEDAWQWLIKKFLNLPIFAISCQLNGKLHKKWRSSTTFWEVGCFSAHFYN